MTLEYKGSENKRNLHKIAVSIENAVLEKIDAKKFKAITSIEDKKEEEKERNDWIHELRKRGEIPEKNIITEYAEQVQAKVNPLMMLAEIERTAISLAPTIKTLKR